MFTHLVSELGLSNNSLVDAYDPEYQTWGQQQISAVQTVKSVPRLLYRARKSLLEGLSDHECPGLDHELRAQHQYLPQGAQAQPAPSQAMSPSTKALKRPAPDAHPTEGANKHFRTASQGYIHSTAHTPTFPPSIPTQTHSGAGTPLGAPQMPSSSPGVQSPYLQRDDALHTTPDGDLSVGMSQHAHPHAHSHSQSHTQQHTQSHSQSHSQPHSQSQQQPAAPVASSSAAALPGGGGGLGLSSHPPLKRWPNDYAVCEIAAGFERMDELIRATPSLTQRAAFERVFGCRYVKSTVCRHRGVWKRADAGLKDGFVRMGAGEGALWNEFVKKTDYRREGPQRAVKQPDDDAAAAAGMGDVGIGYAAMGMNSLGLGVMVPGEGQQPPMASLAPPA